MRLLSTTSLEFAESTDEQASKYAILSHTWRHGHEVTYQEWLVSSTDSPTAVASRHKSGYQKILRAAEKARGNGHDWIWVDTNCIDKASSAELSEAINSMYAWYRASSACYVYLEDVLPLPEASPVTDAALAGFRKSKWWTRGWTLQELLAPKVLIFFAQDWSYIGTRDELAVTIQEITGIRVNDLQREMQHASIARKMSWLGLRQTTRVEDLAYCMLGLFDINMPLLYGEGYKAFIRLQEEIIKKSADTTIFCWEFNDANPPGWAGLLAPCPAAFTNSGCFERRPRPGLESPWSITNLGLSMNLPLLYTLNGACLVMEGVQVEDDPLSLVAVPVTARPNQTFGFLRQALPCGPIIIPNGKDIHHTSNFGSEGHGPLQLLPSQGGPDMGNIQIALEETNQASSRGTDMLLLIGHKRPVQFDSLVSAPASETYADPMGNVKLMQVSVNHRMLLAGALELISSDNRGNVLYLRIFLAFELEQSASHVAGKSIITNHYCEMVEFFQPPALSEPLEWMALPHSKIALPLWFERHIAEVRAGRKASPSRFVDSEYFALQIQSELGRSADSSRVIVVELLQDINLPVLFQDSSLLHRMRIMQRQTLIENRRARSKVYIEDDG